MKHPVPKQKRSKIRVRKQYGAFATAVKKRLTNLVQLTTCPQCGAKKMQHRVCPTCGMYNGREILKMSKSQKKIRTVKA